MAQPEYQSERGLSTAVRCPISQAKPRILKSSSPVPITLVTMFGHHPSCRLCSSPASPYVALQACVAHSSGLPGQTSCPSNVKLQVPPGTPSLPGGAHLHSTPQLGQRVICSLCSFSGRLTVRGAVCSPTAPPQASNRPHTHNNPRYLLSTYFTPGTGAGIQQWPRQCPTEPTGSRRSRAGRRQVTGVTTQGGPAPGGAREGFPAEGSSRSGGRS